MNDDPPCGVLTTSLSCLLSATGRGLRRGAQPDLFDVDGESLRLYCAGDTALIQQPCVAIVGTREPSPNGSARARGVARELARAGIVVMSGLARGIDTDALMAAIADGGRVVGVIGTPIDQAYPAENRRLQERISGEHLLISRFAHGERVRGRNFPMRNRLMAALADATIIIEAGERSGTLHQAAECLRLERWLFISGSLIEDPTLKWPARFLGQPRVARLGSTADILSAVRKRPWKPWKP